MHNWNSINLNGGVHRMSDREPLIGLFGEASDGGGQSPNFILNSLLVHKRLLNAAVHCVHHQLRRARRLLNRVLLRLLWYNQSPLITLNHSINFSLIQFQQSSFIFSNPRSNSKFDLGGTESTHRWLRGVWGRFGGGPGPVGAELLLHLLALAPTRRRRRTTRPRRHGRVEGTIASTCFSRLRCSKPNGKSYWIDFNPQFVC